MFKFRWIFLIFIMSLTLYIAGCDQISPHVSTATLTKVIPSPTAIPQSAMKQVPQVRDIPTHIMVSSIHVDASVETIGIQTNGDLDTPQQNPWTDVGWYKLGTTPGQLGSAVIDGHLDRPGGSAAVFWYLSTIHSGDEIKVNMSSGKLLRFRVTHTALYEPQNAPLQGIFGDNSGSYLNLITCAGDWIASQHQTKLRMVVYSSLEQ